MVTEKPVKTTNPPMPWLDHYPDDIDWHHSFQDLSLPDMFDQACEKYSNHPCTDFMGAVLKYADIADMTNRLAAGLQARGVGPGNRIGLLLPNTPYFIAAYFAVLKTGAIVVNFNPLYSPEELEVQTKDSGITAMITLDIKLLYDRVAPLVNSGLIKSAIICPFTPLLPPLKRLLFKLFKRRDLAHNIPYDTHHKFISYDKITSHGDQPTRVDINPMEDIALLQYTGGTTGIPKGAMLTHANLTINVEQTSAWYPQMALGEEVVMAILPFFHVFAMTTILNLGIRSGGKLILLPRFDVKQAVKTIRATKPTILPGVPTLYTALLEYDGIRQTDLASLKFCISGGAPLPLDVRIRFEKYAGCILVEGYGLSETSPVVSCNPVYGLRKDNSIGQPFPATVIDIRSLDEPGKSMPIGQSGELCIKGPQLMLGYWNQPDATQAAIIDGYFHTGDVGYVDEQGFFFIIDRIKDMINCSGYKVYPRRIEEALHDHDAVAEVSVIGIPDSYRGEAPKAFIKLQPGKTATAEELMEFLKNKLSKIEMPEEIEFRKELPKTMIGKLSKKDLRQAK